jgi:plastocyanin
MVPQHLKSGLPVLIVSFVVAFVALLAGARLVQPDLEPAANGAPGEQEPGPGPGGPAGTRAEVAARSLQFSPRVITVAANTEVTVAFRNEDAGVLHNISVYRDRSASQSLFMGELFPGVGTRDYVFPSPAPGSYFFRCDVHPDTMTGTFTTQ